MKNDAKISTYDDARCKDNICSKMKAEMTPSGNFPDTQ